MINVYLELEAPEHRIKQSFENKAGQPSVEETITFRAYCSKSKRFTLSNGDRFARDVDVAYEPGRPNVIGGLMILTKDRGGAAYEMMTYNSSNSQIFFQAKLDAEVFDILLGDLRAELPPTVASVQIDSDFVTTPLRFGPSPDGDHLVWNVETEEHNRLPIEAIRFVYLKPEPTPPTSDDLENAERLREERDFDIRQRFAVIEPLKELVKSVRLLFLLGILLGLVLWFK